MDHALYFPHTTPRDKTVLKEALLLWDELEFIIPWDGFVDHHADPDTRAALEVIGRPIAPSVATKRRTHRRIKQLIGEGLPSKYLFRPGERAAPIYADKLARETWDMLLRGEMIAGEFRLTNRFHSAHSYELSKPLALAIMTILADECAGKTARKVTDAVYASDADAAYLTRDLGGDIECIDPEQETYVVTLPLPVISVHDVSVTQLTVLRQKESDFLRELRRNYRREVDKYIDQITASGSYADDIRRITDAFNGAMRERLRELDRMLDRRSKITEFSVMEVLGAGWSAGIATYLTSASSLAAALASVTAIGIGGAFKISGSIPLNEEKREEVQRKNPAAWLYHVQEHAATA